MRRASTINIVQHRNSNISVASWTKRKQLEEATKKRWVLWVEKRMLEPYQPKQIAWEFAGSIMLLYDIFVLPLSIAFNPDPNTFTDTMIWGVRLFWTFDIVVNFLTGYVDEQGETIMNLRQVARHYLKNAFPLDVLVVIFDWLDALIGVRATGLFKSWRLVRIVRLLRLRKAHRLWDRLSEYVEVAEIMVMVRVVKNLMILLVFLHFVACGAWGLGELQVSGSGGSWTANIRDVPLDEQYARAFHLGIALFFGEHILLPFSQLERVYTILVIYVSFVWQIWFVSSITTAMTHLEIVSSKRSSMFTSLDRFLTVYRIKRELRLKLHRSAKHGMLAKERNTQETSIELLHLVSEPLIMRLHVDMFFPTLRRAPWLCCFQAIDEPAVVRLCHYAVSVEEVAREDIVFSEGTSPIHPSVRFVAHGSAQYVDPYNGKTLIGKQHWLSEYVLWTEDWVHKGTLQAVTECQIFLLDAAVFRNIMGAAVNSNSLAFYAELALRLAGETDITDVFEYKKDMEANVGLCFADAWEEVKGEFREVPPESAQHGDGPSFGKALSGQHLDLPGFGNTAKPRS